MTDLEIAHNCKMKNIDLIAKEYNINDVELYGKYKLKINSVDGNRNGNVILVTATSPTPFGEGKTTISISLVDALCKSSKSIGCLREPSLGPVFGLKGGACGGGHSQVVPMEDINLHFTGDIHAITAANNLLCAAIDNHIKQGNELNITKVLFKRCIDMNDRALKNITLDNGRKESFKITAASEIMAIICLSKDFNDLRKRLENIVIGLDQNNKMILAKELNIVGSLCVLLKDAIKPNLVQTLENNPIIIHGGPFANIACGCSSVIATNYAKKISDYVVTEAGFGSDCGALKYYDIISRDNDVLPKVVVLVTTIKALKYNGIENLNAHINILKNLTNNIIVCLNKFEQDTDDEILNLENYCHNLGVSFSVSTAFVNGGNGSLDLANKVKKLCDEKTSYQQLYNLSIPLEEKIEKIVKNIYKANKINYTEKSLNSIKLIKENNFNDLPICIAKTQYSISDDKNKLGYPKDYEVTIEKIELNNGAGYIIVYLGNILTMPGLPKQSNYEFIDIKDGEIIGLF